MFRKLTSLLFSEEEIVVKEEEHEIEPVNIPKLEPMQSKSDAVESNTIEFPKQTPLTDDADDKMAKKSFRIDVDNTAKPKQAQSGPLILEKKKDASKPYIAHEIISPIHGGPSLQKEPLQAVKPQVKKRPVLTEVISPMYGMIEETKKDSAKDVDLSLLEMDVESMITPDYNGAPVKDEVQTTLFDYLEGEESSDSE